MKGILIDCDTQTVSEVEHNGDYRDIYRLIGAQPFDVRPLHGVEDEVVYFDDEFLLRDKAKSLQWYADIEGLPDPIGGKLLILGTYGPESTDTKMTVAQVEQLVSYRQLKLVGWTPMQTVKDGNFRIIRGPRPIFDSDPTPGKPRSADTIKSDEADYRSQHATIEQIKDFLGKGGFKI